MSARRFVAASFLATALLAPPAGRAGTLGTDIIGVFPKEVGEFAYADLKGARRFAWFAQLKEQMLPARFRQFEQFLLSVNIDPNRQVNELAWAAVAATPTSGEQIVGVALGHFSPATAELIFRARKLPLEQASGHTLFAFGSGEGAGDLFFLFLDSNTAVFGHRAVIDKLLDVRFGKAESLLRNTKLFPLIAEANGRGLVWAVLDQGYARLGLHQLVPETTQFPEAGKLMERVNAMVVSIEADRGVDARFQGICASPEDANLFAALLQAGLLYRRFQESQANPDLAKMLDEARITPRGERLELRLSLTEELLLALIRKNVFAVKI